MYAARVREGRGQGWAGSAAYAQHDGDEKGVWEVFFDMMMTCVDLALCEGWIVPDDFSEPFIQLGMPAMAVAEIALQSRDNIGVTLGDGVVVTVDMLQLASFEDSRELFQEVEAVKLALVKSRVRSREEETFVRRASISAGAKDLPDEIPLERRNELNGILAMVQRVAIKITQKAFYKEQSEDLIAEMTRREQLGS
jgi:hypothetical protein